MALFGSGKKSIMEDLAQQLAAHPMLQWAAQVLRRTEPRNCEQKAADAWKHCVEDYYDDGTRTVLSIAIIWAFCTESSSRCSHRKRTNGTDGKCLPTMDFAIPRMGMSRYPVIAGSDTAM